MIVDIRYSEKKETKTIELIDYNLISHFEHSCKEKGYLDTIKRLLERNDIHHIIIDKYD